MRSAAGETVESEVGRGWDLCSDGYWRESKKIFRQFVHGMLIKFII